MKKLIVTANPSVKAFTHKIAEKLEEVSKAAGQETEILDLYRTELRQDFLAFEDSKEMGRDETTKEIQKKIRWADEIVFVFPIWWGDAPAIMKNFIDCNFGAGFAFQYVNGKPVGLLKGKAARVIATSGAPSFFYKVLLHIQLLWSLNRIGFCGIEQKSFTVFGGMDSSDSDKSRYLETVAKLV